VGSGDIMQAKWGSHGDYPVIALSPWSVQEMYDLTLRAFNFSERYRIPTFVMAEEATGHLRETVHIETQVEVWDRKKKKGGSPFGTGEEDGVPPMPAFGEGERLAVTGSTHDAYGFRKTDDPGAHSVLVERINQKISRNRQELVETESYWIKDSDVVVISYGFTARTALYAVKRMRKEGFRLGLLRLKTLWPFPEEAVREATARAKNVFVPEMNRGQVAGEVRKFSSSEVISFGQTNGEIIRPETIEETLKRMK
jgi:2-oxoglutarate ferredoxin oxidoreductase subunit alpha